MTQHDPTFLTDPYRPPKTEDADPPPVDDEVRRFTVTLLKRVAPGRFWLPSADTLVLFCGLFTVWSLTHAPAGDWRVGESRTLPEPRAVQATWGADGWRVSGVEVQP